MTDFRALCDELLDELKYQTDWSSAEELKERASAALAEPEPKPPTDEDLWHTADDEFRSNVYPSDAVKFARAVLNRYGNPTP